MNDKPIDQERPYLRPDHASYYTWIVAALAAALVAAAAYYLYDSQRASLPLTNAPVAAPAPEAPAPAPQAAAEPEIRLPAPEPAPKPLPALENSDSMMREGLARLLGR